MTAPTLFTQEGNATFVATGYARGPWDPRACHGGPVSALLARQVEGIADDGIEWQVARITIELLRPVPIGVPLVASTAVERPGRKVSLVAASLHAGDTEVARARSLRIRHTDLGLPDGTVHPPDDRPGRPEEGRAVDPFWHNDSGIAYHTNAVTMRFFEGGWDQSGPCVCWIRLDVPVVAGEDPSGLQRVAAAVDFGNGISRGLDSTLVTFINPDLTIHLLRPPQGQWVGMRTSSYYGAGSASTGAGFAESAVYDSAGRLGRSVQSLLLDQQ